MAIVDNRCSYPCAPTVFLPPLRRVQGHGDLWREAIYRRTIIHLDQHAVPKILRIFPDPAAPGAVVTAVARSVGRRDLAHCHHHIDHLFSCYKPPMNGEHRKRLVDRLNAMLPDDHDGEPGNSRDRWAR